MSWQPINAHQLIKSCAYFQLNNFNVTELFWIFFVWTLKTQYFKYWTATYHILTLIWQFSLQKLSNSCYLLKAKEIIETPILIDYYLILNEENMSDYYIFLLQYPVFLCSISLVDSFFLSILFMPKFYSIFIQFTVLLMKRFLDLQRILWQFLKNVNNFLIFVYTLWKDNYLYVLQ